MQACVRYRPASEAAKYRSLDLEQVRDLRLSKSRMYERPARLAHHGHQDRGQNRGDDVAMRGANVELGPPAHLSALRGVLSGYSQGLGNFRAKAKRESQRRER